MINNNKILTVSYGTFSCTLEGFDDSFGTMKAIAEYFRDLSADDRYFGAEPIQPDAQMLARIAQREISRHVEAREDHGRIVLSAQNAPEKAAARVASDAVDDVADAIAEATVTKNATPSNPAAPDTAPAPTPAGSAPAAETALKRDVVRSIPQPVINVAPALTPRDIVPSLPDEEVEAFFADSKSTEQTNPEATSNEAIEEDIAQSRAKADSIADKLKRIRAVVSQQGEAAKAPATADYSEDEHAEAPAALAHSQKFVATEQEAATETAENTTDTVLASTRRDLEDALDADDATETEAQIDDGSYDDAADESEEDNIAAILSRLESEAETSSAAFDRLEQAEPAGDPDTASFDNDEDADDLDGNILAAMDRISAGTAVEDAADENLFEDEKHETPAAPVTPSLATAPVAPRTRVLKVKRATLEAAIKSGQLEEYDDTPEAAQADPAPLRKAPLAERSSLSDEAEEALARELAELEADMDAGDTPAPSRTDATFEALDETFADDDFEDEDDFEDDDVEDDDVEDDETADYDDEEDETTVAAPVARSRMSPPADEDFSRLMEESKHQMEEPEAATRRDAFAHLRAAVAAKKADEAVGVSDTEEDTGEAYRDDLANVVRPRRPVSTEGSRTGRPVEARPAPLKLVAEQRIDAGEVRSAVPVRPRRVAAIVPQPDQHTASNAEGFADFADEMGATKLPDLLEAAAAYLSFVEGRENFSRPQLITKVRQVEKENFTREDSLRSFGKLLREGKIEKMKGGRYQASEQIGFKPAKRAAG
ncbi:hypothetical protein [Sulfitobacter guttiformis]|uniref:Lipoprotein n=1 Tax=Sulfitobacter guttiformis TaxID=74349 RepID=A0A420DJN7_9RHOB|nr:hypothetical protein [Sulfitobacter guttiformis]KIN71721.1 putative lipoprotein [Sulfitobacter guttiformis KCTC 32187]RKE94456.1 hypothetical protein C8N30_3584 [Sulfitobacter guttiformis]